MKQTEQILDYMRTYGTITPLEALKDCGCMRLAARISDLRKAGHNITSRKVAVIRRDGSKAFVERYTINE